MNLGKLLAAGKSIMNGRADISYRSNKQVYLPKFGPAKNPFKNETAAETAGGSPSQASPAETTKPAVALNSIAASPVGPRPVRAANEEADALAAGDTASTIAQKLPALPAMREKKAGWTGKLNPISIFRGAPVKPEAKAEGEPTVQAELSLDSVRVLHNDLSDVDVEVVPMKSRTGAPQAAPAKRSLEILGKRLFGVEPT
jgi:hypothetical protein